MSRPALTAVEIEQGRNNEVYRALRALPVTGLIRAAASAMRIHPDLALPFARAILSEPVMKEPK
jgi:hypothetical protein